VGSGYDGEVNPLSLDRRQFFVGSAALAFGCATPVSGGRRHDASALALATDDTDPQAMDSVDLWMGYGPDALRLDKNENPFGPSPKAVHAAKAALTHANRYVNPALLAKRLSEFHDVDPTMVQLGTGSGEILRVLPIAFMRDGGNLVTATEAYRAAPESAVWLGREVRWIPMRNDWTYDVEGMLAAVDDQTRLFCLVNPNNPTGTMISRSQILQIAKAIPSTTALVVDEAYVQFLPKGEPSAIDLVATIPNLMVLRTFSKVYGLAGLRVGYAIAQPPLIERLAPAVPSWPSVVAYAAAGAAVEDEAHVRRFVEHAEHCRAFYREKLTALELDYQLGHAPLVMVRLGADLVPKAIDSLAKQGILIRSGRAWGVDDWIRISFGLEEANERVIAALATWIANVKA